MSFSKVSWDEVLLWMNRWTLNAIIHILIKGNQRQFYMQQGEGAGSLSSGKCESARVIEADTVKGSQ